MSNDEEDLFGENESDLSSSLSVLSGDESRDDLLVDVPIFLRTPVVNRNKTTNNKSKSQINDSFSLFNVETCRDILSEKSQSNTGDLSFDEIKRENEMRNNLNELSIDLTKNIEYPNDEKVRRSENFPIINHSNDKIRDISDDSSSEKLDKSDIFSSDGDENSDEDRNDDSDGNSDEKENKEGTNDNADNRDNIFMLPSQTLYEEVIKEHIRTNPGKKIVLNFIHSLLDIVDNKYRDEEAHRYRINYKYWKEKLARKIFEIFNEHTFDNKLPHDTKIIFSVHLTKTAGVCKYHGPKGEQKRTIEIIISTKVCTDTERLLTTMIHEMCHGACWMINGIDGHHGPVWRAWCARAKMTYPLVALSSVCHNYTIHTKYEYRCINCSFCIKRHSKLKNKSSCKRCLGELVPFSDGGYGIHLKVDENKPLNDFAAFIKEHYKTVRTKENNISHKDAMKILSKEFQNEKVKLTEELKRKLLIEYRQ